MQLPAELLQQCWFLAGPTATGKSDVGVEVAQRVGAEIISMDSMSLYRGMDIGTAKPSPQQRAAVPHHLVDVVDPAEEFSVADYLAAASKTAEEIVARGRIPLFVGGTGLYLRSLMRGIFDGPSADRALRSSFESAAGGTSLAELHARLERIDPETARKVHPSDSRRIIRALEVHERSGRPISELRRQGPLPREQRPPHAWWLSPPRGWLYDRINRRVERMFDAGLLDEVRRLLEGAATLGRTARQALGYKEAIDHLEGRRSLSETIATVQTRTRQFAKRQHTWFRHIEECRALEISGEETPRQLAERLRTAAS